MGEYIEVRIPKAILHLKSSEIHRLLMKDPELFKDVLRRSKAIERAKSHQHQYEQKWSKDEGDSLGFIH